MIDLYDLYLKSRYYRAQASQRGRMGWHVFRGRPLVTGVTLNGGTLEITQDTIVYQCVFMGCSPAVRTKVPSFWRAP